MRTPPGGLRLAVVVAVIAAAITVPPAYAAVRHDLLPLHVGSAGPNCALAKYLERKPRPKQNVFTQVQGTYLKTSGMGGYCNDALAAATTAYKWRLGYPKKWVKPVVGRYFLDLLTGKKKRPVDWVRVAAGRLKAIEAATPTPIALRWKAQLVAWLGVHETYSNSGPCISSSCTWGGRSYAAIQSSTGAYHAAWCVSTEQQAGILAGFGTFADRTAGVYYAVDYANARGWLSAKAKFASLVAFITLDSRGYRVAGTGHMGFVTKVTSTGFSYIAGNDGNAVREHFILYGSRRYVFIRLPGVVK